MTALASRSPIPDLCPPATISLVTGASHSGKREFLYALCDDLLSGRPILDPARVPYAGTRADRPLRLGWLTLTHGDPQTAQTLLESALTRHELASVLTHPQFAARALCTSDLVDKLDIALPCPLTRTRLLDVFSGAFGTRPGSHSTLALPDLLILDNIHTLLLDASPNSPYHVSRLLQSLQTTLQQTGVTLLALALASKLKSSERYDKIPDKLLGSVVWGHEAHSVWYVDSSDPDEKLALADPDSPVAAQHKLVIVRQGDPPEQHWLERDRRGLLVKGTLDAMAAVEWGAALDAWLGLQRAGTAVVTSEAVEIAAKSGASRYQAQRWLRKQVEDGRLVTESWMKQGMYQVRAKA